MATLQIKGMDDDLYAQVKRMAADDNRSISQEVLHLIRQHLSLRQSQTPTETSAASLLKLAGSWEDDREAEDIVRAIRSARRNARQPRDL